MDRSQSTRYCIYNIGYDGMQHISFKYRHRSDAQLENYHSISQGELLEKSVRLYSYLHFVALLESTSIEVEEPLVRDSSEAM